MKYLGQRYVQYVNRTYRRSGALWEGRFRSCLAQSEDYVLACYRYIELNPVRANMARHPREYRWSSYRANAEGRSNELLQPHEMYKRLGRSAESRREAYRGLFTPCVNAIYLGGSGALFFTDLKLVLQEYYHVLRQWNTGELSTFGYIVEWARQGFNYDKIKYEVQAQEFANQNAQRYRSLLEQQR